VSGRLVADTKLETSGTPVNKLDRTLSLDNPDGGVDVLGDNITTVEQSASHVFALPRITLHHLVARLEARESHISDIVLLVMGFLSRDDRGKGRKREVDTRERNQVGLELIEINIERAIEAQRSSDGRNNLGNQPVEVDETGRGDVEVLLADVVNGFVIDHERAVGMLKGRVGGEDGVVRFDNGVGQGRSGVHAEL